MRLLYIAPRYHPYIGGVEHAVKSVAERLAKRGQEVAVLCGEPGIDSPREEWINNVHVARWPIRAPGDTNHFLRMRGALEH
ncbi:MAG: glycosyltransferase [candidate division WOR-3 bacterium]